MMGMQVILDFSDRAGIRIRRVFSQPKLCLVAHTLDEVVPLLRQVCDFCHTGSYAAGFVAYEAAAAFDPSLVTHLPYPDLPLAMFGIYDAPQVEADSPHSTLIPSTQWKLDHSFDEYLRTVTRLQQAIAAGETYQVNLTLRALSQWDGDSGAALYEHLIRVQAADYSAHLKWDKGSLLSLSPELFFRTEGQQIITMPMKGTADPGFALADCPKNRAENVMIVDLLRNDLGRLACPGSVRVSDLFQVLELPTVSQMTSTVSATLPPSTRLDDIFRALFPCGSVTGAPKRQTMHWIREVETSPRGAYCGAIGWVKPGGDAQFSVAIRTLWHRPDRNLLNCGVGSGIIWDSRAHDEWQEIATKTHFLKAQPAPFDLLETLRLDEGQWILVAEHFQRLTHSIATLGFPALDAERFQNALEGFSAQYPTGNYRVRLCYNRQGHLHLSGFALPPPPSGLQPIRLAQAPFSFDPILVHKTTERSRYDALWSKEDSGLFDILLWNERGELTEFTRGNLVVQQKGEYYTPPLHCGLLAGTLRQSLHATGMLTERVLFRHDLEHAEQLWFINSVRGWIPVTLVPTA